ncbi:unnamed protein product [Dovyalis caffra]|uniref:Uncharacterized protein n=1 Tax=Dovyalis caffra TaxID=77055 RepID=A0AAV1R8A6_9ROSI|nr:unnamed protein product [Dovyalis caffra]
MITKNKKHKEEEEKKNGKNNMESDYESNDFPNAGRVLSHKSDVIVHVFGKGKWRHLAIENGISRNGYVDSVEKEDMFLGSDGQPKLSVSLAR